MTVEPKGRTGDSDDDMMRGSLEPTDAWIGLDLHRAPAGHGRLEDPARRTGRSRSMLRVVAVALLAGAAGAWLAQGGAKTGGDPVVSADATGSIGQTDKELAEIEAKRATLLSEIQQLESQRSREQGEVSELADRRTNLNDELTELERQRQEWLQQLAVLEAQAKGPDGATPSPPIDPDAAASPPDADPAAPPQPVKAIDPEAEQDRKKEQERKAATEVAKLEEERKAKLEQDQKVEEERKARLEAVAVLQRKEEETQKRVRELQEKKAVLAHRKREREVAAPPQQPEPARTLQERLFGKPPERSGPVVGFERRDRSALLPPPPRFFTPESGRRRVFVHFAESDPEARDKAHALAERLEARGFEVAELRAVRGRFRGNKVRYFHDQDQAAAPALGGTVSRSLNGTTLVQDYRGYSRRPGEGTLEVWVGD